MTQRRKASPLMGAAQAVLDGVSDSLLREDSQFRHSMELHMERVKPDPEQPRKSFDKDGLEQLARTMAEQGQLQPILVKRDPSRRGHWIIVAGERRWRAAAANGWKTILAIEHAGDSEVATLIENLQRVDLNPLEEARGLDRLLQQKGWSQARAAQVLSKTAPEISSILRILTLPEDLLTDLLATKDSAPSRYVLSELARLEAGPARDHLFRVAREGNLTQRMVRAARAEVTPAPAKNREPTRARELILSPRVIQSFRNRVRGMRDGARLLLPEERESLERLRAAISEVLDEISVPADA